MAVLSVVLLARGGTLERVIERMLEPAILVGGTVSATALAVLVLLAMVRRRLRESSPERPLAPVGVVGAPRRAILAAVGQAVVVVIAFVLVARFLPRPPQEPGPLQRLAQAGGWSRAGWALLAVLVAPPSEELVFRGVLYTGLARSWGAVAAGILTTLTFTAFHITEIRGYWPAWVIIGLVGALLLRARVKSGSLVPGIALHATYNAGLVVLTALASAAR
jgi:membrane protease YdiL (CAAX protease family)